MGVTTFTSELLPTADDSGSEGLGVFVPLVAGDRRMMIRAGTGTVTGVLIEI